MNRGSSVLQTFCILGPEEILKLSEVSVTMQTRKVSGDSFVLIEEPALKSPEPKTEAKVLPFGRPKQQFEALEERREEKPSTEKEEEKELPSIIGSDFALLQREKSKEADVAIRTSSAKAGYKQSTDLFIIKTKTLEGKEKIHFASTNGVLVNKKQA